MPIAPLTLLTASLIVAGSGSAVPAETPPSDMETPTGAVTDVSRPFHLPSTLFLVREDQATTTVTNGPTQPATVLQPFEPAKLAKVVYYGLQLTFYEHVMRIATQSFTREQLKGKFWPDYFHSIHWPQQWADKDRWQVNVLGHAISGGAFTRVWMEQREPKPQSFSQYLKSLGKATVYTTIFSLQYEMGPMSEASIGNVGLNPQDLGWTDWVWTPIGGMLWTMGENATDKWVLTWIDRHSPFMTAKAAARCILNPSRLLANVGMNRTPWSRADRTLDGTPVVK